MPAITYGYLPVVTKALAAADHSAGFTTTIATQGVCTQAGTTTTDFVLYSGDFPGGGTVTGVSARVIGIGAPGTPSTVSAFAINTRTGVITSLGSAADVINATDHEVSVPFTVPVNLSAEQKLMVFVSGQNVAAFIVKGVLVSFVPGP